MNSWADDPLTSTLAALDNLDASFTRLITRIDHGTKRMLDQFADITTRLDDLLASQQSVVDQLRAGHVHNGPTQQSRRSGTSSSR